jgi:alkyl hydroperoxide reductase subunit AhpC
MESLGVPTLGIGDQIPPSCTDSTLGKIDIHDWIMDSQTYNPGEEIFCILLTFPSVRNPVVASEIAFLGRFEVQKELIARKIKVLIVVTSGLFEVNNFLRELPHLMDVSDWNLGPIPVLADETGDMQRELGCTRPGVADGVRGRVPSNLTLIVSPRLEVVYRSEYPVTTGRNYNEIFRVIDSLKITFVFPRLGTWANWQAGGQEGMLVMPSLEDGSVLTDEECDKMFVKGKFECLFPWFRITPVPDLPGETSAASEEDSNS